MSTTADQSVTTTSIGSASKPQSVESIIDLSKYRLHNSEKSFCRCGQVLHMLIPYDARANLSLFSLCEACGVITQIGKGQVFPT